MPELVVTRHNPLVDPLLHVWGWQIPLYLFLGGWVAGMMIIAGVVLYFGRHRERNCVCGVLPSLSFALLSLGMLALFLDLEHKRYVWRLYTTFRVTSPMSWGAWILILVYPALAAAWVVRPPGLLRDLAVAGRYVPAGSGFGRIVRAVGSGLGRVAALSDRVGASRTAIWWIAAANIVLGIALGIYTGVLLSGLGARPFWSSALLGPLFLLSGLSSAAAFTHLVARDPVERVLLAKTDNVFLGLELFTILLFLVGLLSASQAHADAARLVLGGPFTAVFWVGVVGLGIVFPLAIQSLAVTHRIVHTPLAPLFVMAGGLLLRFVFVVAGQASHWPRGAW
jgi:formate-dependent nitrite reductase membrane component NrfD